MGSATSKRIHTYNYIEDNNEYRYIEFNGDSPDFNVRYEHIKAVSDTICASNLKEQVSGCYLLEKLETIRDKPEYFCMCFSQGRVL